MRFGWYYIFMDLSVEKERKTGQPDIKKDDKYAQSLLMSLNTQMEIEREREPVHHFFSKKLLIYLAISIVFTIVASIFSSSFKNKTNNGQDTTKELLNYTSSNNLNR